MATTEIAPTLTLQERVADRIKQQIGELIEPEDLKKLVERAMEDAFFKPILIQRAYGQPEERLPVVVQTVKTLMEPMVREQLAAWFVANDAKVTAMIDAVIRDGVLNVCIAQLNGKLQSDLYNFGNLISQRLVGKPL